ncbi:hypothetical protein DMA12_15260 [Amycolatopsis balhimycina DSM 5908]|uniref:Beta-lactamase-related domain-containing protein n=2 Tax=Amycolatopsis balhimycina TaxID=208443 RepID=A0A428WPB6_AMYBA|nr:hypothetical protein DMA12_15260 [Amycolatopsis balhimycina DSM 5908]
MSALVVAGAAGVQVRVHDGLGDWTGSAGLARLGRPEGVPGEGRFRIGSVTKPFVAAVALMLAAEGELGLDAPVGRYLPDFDLDGAITVRYALMHLSGLADYSGDHRPDGAGDPGIFPPIGPEYIRKLTTGYEPAELIRFALARGPRFEPGRGFFYSNTNYLLAQLVIEKITGTSYADQIRRRITRPLGMASTLVPSGPRIPGPHAHGYVAYRDHGDLTVADVTEAHPSWYGAAGSIVSTTADLDTFVSALLTGRLLAPPQLAEMLAFVPPDGDGVGIGLFRKEFGPGRFGIGHFGSVPGFLCFTYGVPDGSARMVLSANRGAVDRSDPAAVAAFLAAVDKAVTTCFAALHVPDGKLSEFR